MSDNPFLETGDDPTVIQPIARAPDRRPAPRPAALRAALDPEANPIGADAPSDVAFDDVPPLGASVIMTAAAPLLALLARLRNVVTVPDPAALRERTIDELRRFEQRLRSQNVALELLRPAHYALCASLDDTVRNTPWGSKGAWADTSLVAAFHREVRSGERFFDLLDQLCRDAGKFLPVIELMFVCMSLGMQGRYRLAPRGPAELDRVREKTYALLMRLRGPAEPALSVHWQGVAAPYRPLRSILPVWVTAVGTAGLLALLYVLFTFRLNDTSDHLFETALALPPGHMPAIVHTPPPQPAPITLQPTPERDKLTGLLAPEIAQGVVSIAGTDAVPIIRIQAAGLFKSGSAEIEPSFVPLLKRIGSALTAEPGQVSVIGYTDNVPIHTLAFPSNFQLSRARAGAAAAVVGAGLDPARLTVEGRADAEPIAPNNTPAGRERNRRIEVVLRRSSAG